MAIPATGCAVAVSFADTWNESKAVPTELLNTTRMIECVCSRASFYAVKDESGEKLDKLVQSPWIKKHVVPVFSKAASVGCAPLVEGIISSDFFGDVSYADRSAAAAIAKGKGHAEIAELISMHTFKEETGDEFNTSASCGETEDWTDRAAHLSVLRSDNA